MNFVTGIAVTILFLTSIRAIPANYFSLNKEVWRGLIAVRSQNDMTESSFPIPLKTTSFSYQEYVKNKMNGHAMKITGQESQFRHIEQPIELKLAVTLGGLILIGLEIWWFLLSQTVSTTEKKR